MIAGLDGIRCIGQVKNSGQGTVTRACTYWKHNESGLNSLCITVKYSKKQNHSLL